MFNAPLTTNTTLTSPIRARANLTASPSRKCRLAGLSVLPATPKPASRLASTKRQLPSFDHDIRFGKQRSRDRQTDLFGGFEIDCQHEPARRFERQLGGIGAFENAHGKSRSAIEHLAQIRAI